MSVSDWSSDVCSSDLSPTGLTNLEFGVNRHSSWWFGIRKHRTRPIFFYLIPILDQGPRKTIFVIKDLRVLFLFYKGESRRLVSSSLRHPPLKINLESMRTCKPQEQRLPALVCIKQPSHNRFAPRLEKINSSRVFRKKKLLNSRLVGATPMI